MGAGQRRVQAALQRLTRLPRAQHGPLDWFLQNTIHIPEVVLRFGDHPWARSGCPAKAETDMVRGVTGSGCCPYQSLSFRHRGDSLSNRINCLLQRRDELVVLQRAAGVTAIDGHDVRLGYLIG
jgi:hypothetical protein